jgi:energy-coupling factor transport system substrate-specific component
MSWQLTSYALLGLVLVGGFAWYERSRPPARMVALVAALAALAVAGRLAFAPIPNVVATTDIVLITGFAVGAAPGFAVGALAAAVSNLWLGQGPWTPWEMAGWGMVGLGGAALGALTGRRLGRIGLAAACGFAGLAYGALLDLSVMVGYGGEQSLDRYLAISARGVPFNVAHALGNIVLALVAGPALVRMISRYRGRFEFRWREAGVASLVLALVTILALTPPPAGARGGASSAAHWLRAAQNSDGGFGPDPGGASSATMTGWVALGLEAAGRSPFAVAEHGATPIGYLKSRVAKVRSIGDLERTILALEGAGVDSRSFAGRDLVAHLQRHRAHGGSFDGQVNLTAFGILALRSAGVSRSSLHRPAEWLRHAENRDGGWGFQPQAPSDADSTGAALEGLAAAGAGTKPLHRGVRFLRRSQEGDGGFALGGGGPSNAQSTAWAVQGLVAAGANPAAVRRHGRSPIDYLAARQAGDGHYEYSRSSDQTAVWVTAQALVAVRREPFPLRPVPRPSPKGHGSAHRAGDSSTSSSSSTAATGPATTAPASGGSSPSGGRQTRSSRAGGGDRPGGGGGSHRHAGVARATGRPSHDRLVQVSAPADPAVPPAAAGDSHTAACVAGGLTALAVALAAGFLWYRRRLP